MKVFPHALAAAALIALAGSAAAFSGMPDLPRLDFSAPSGPEASQGCATPTAIGAPGCTTAGG